LTRWGFVYLHIDCFSPQLVYDLLDGKCKDDYIFSRK